MLYAYCEYLKGLPQTPERNTTIEAIQHGAATIGRSVFDSLMLSLRTASRAVEAISDLSLLVLRNHAQVPFIMGDAPCVFSNHYMRTVKGMGVLGYLTPGLAAVLPIDPRTQVLLYDSNVYTPEYSAHGYVDVWRISDVSLLNALQVHSAEENVYFSDWSDQPYVRDLLSAHRSILRHQQGRFIVHGSGQVLMDGVPNTGEVLHVYEPQLPITLDLSFISTASLPPSENPNRPRDPVLAQKVIRSLGLADKPSAVGMDDLAEWIESSIDIPGGR